MFCTINWTRLERLCQIQQPQKGLPMKYTHFDDIAPNNRTEFAMLYFATMRTMRKLEAAIRKTNNGRLTGRQADLLLHLQHKLEQMVALWKSNSSYKPY